MRVQVVKRYSECFKRRVVEDLEKGRFSTMAEARSHHGIAGMVTIQRWLKRYGRNHLLAKVVRVEKPDERDRIGEYRRQISELQRALGRTQAENVLNAEFLKLACEALGQDVEAFKKKFAGRRSTPPVKRSRGK